MGGSLRRSGRETEGVGRSLVDATRSARIMAGTLASELHPALGQIVTSASTAASRLGSLIGIAAVVAVTIGTALVRSLNTAAESQAKFNLALRSGDVGALRGDLRTAAEELEAFAEKSKTIAGRISNFFTRAFDPFNDPAKRAGRARAGIEQLSPAETRRETAQASVGLFQTQIQELDQFASRAAATNDLLAFERHLSAISLLLDRIADNARLAAEATRDLELMEAKTLDLGPAGIERINQRFNVAAQNIEAQRQAAQLGLQTRLESGRAEIQPRRRDVSNPVFDIGEPGAFSPEERNAAIAAANKPLSDLALKLQSVNREANLMGIEFDRGAAELEATKRAILDFNPAVENADQRLQALTTRFEELRQAENLKEIFRTAFDGLRGAVSGTVEGIIQGTLTMQQAFANMGRNIAASLIENVINKGLKIVQDAVFRFLEELAKVGLARAFAGAFAGALTSGVSSTTTGTGTAGTTLQGLQHGGLVTSPELTWIAERGPEAVIPLQHGAVPVRLLGGEMKGDRGGTIIQIINQGAPAEATSSEAVGDTGERIHRIVLREIKRAGQTGELDSVMSIYNVRRPGLTR